MARGLPPSLAVLVAAGLMLPQPAHAEEPYYFHKSGVSREGYASDVDDCAALAGGVRVGSPNLYAANPTAAGNLYAVAIGSLFAGFMVSRQRRQMVSRVERTCMADKGYQRRAVDHATISDIRKLDDRAKLDRMFALASAEQPQGKVLVE